MAIDSKKLTSDQFRDILVTDIDWMFDYGVRDSVTLREGDMIDRTSEPGVIVLTLQSLVVGGLPEIVRHQTSKIISERQRLRVMQVRIDPPTGTGPTGDTGAGSGTLPVDPAPPDSGASPTADTVSPAGPVAMTPSGSPSPRPRRPRRKTPPPPDRD